MKISMVTGVWKRPEVFEMFAKGVHHLNAEIEDLNLQVICAGSEGSRSRKMVEKHGFHYIEIPNNPLAVKMNATTLKAKELDSDYVICMGSDDIIHPELMKIFLYHMNRRCDFIGLTDFYFYDTETDKALYWGGYRERYRRGVTAGASRIISKHLMNRWDWMPWFEQHNDFLDNSMQGRIRGKQKILNCKRLGMYALDIKSSTNMTPFEAWDNTTFIDSSIIKEKFSYLFE